MRGPNVQRRCPKCRKTAAECLRFGEHYPYRECCKRCSHKPETKGAPQ